jgi:cytochrome P450
MAMGEALHTVTTLPTARQPGCPFDPPAELIDARRHGPISRYTFPRGKPGWLITGYDLVRSVLADSRFSSRKELMRHPSIDMTGMEIPAAPPGEFLLMDEPQHGRYRKPLVGKFTGRRMRLLTEHVEQITVDHLDAMEKAGPPADLVTAFAKPIPAIMICELLGVPYQDRGSFQEQIESFLSGAASDQHQIAAYTATQHYLAELVAAKRANPTDDVLSDLTASDLTDEELRGISLLLLAAGFDTTANTLALGTFALLRNPAQLAALRADPALADRAVEELLRYLSVAKTFMRTALEDVELGSQTIEAGTTVILSYNTANRDPERFADPHVLDLRRQDGGHLAFGHGIHQCLGQQLARVELRVAFPALVNRFPTLRLAVPAEEVDLRPETADIYGVKSLPVTWTCDREPVTGEVPHGRPPRSRREDPVEFAKAFLRNYPEVSGSAGSGNG